MALYDEILLSINSELQSNTEITAERHRLVEIALLNYISGSFNTGDIKEVDCTEAYIATNFDSTGLGRYERDGWAICNGANGTRNRNGRVGIARGTSYPSVGTAFNSPVIGGEERQTLQIVEMPAHYHHTPGSVFKSFAAGSGDYGNSSSQGRGSDNGDNGELAIGNLSSNYNTGGAALERTVGGNQSHNNMQPYIVSLFIMKL